ncbi:MAG: TIGR01459 family HAD-type hydrolase [Rhodospirillales bacterium]|nr:TIGR01459 family HAD-type hydrolase [Rhodospirillales bacterium]
MQHLEHFAPLAARYGGFIVDLWGVVHDGVAPYPGAVECLRRLRDAGRRVVLLSNAPRRAGVAAAGMRTMGITADLYTGIVTSGEVTHALLRDRDLPAFAALGRRLYHIGPERDRNVFVGLDYVDVARPADADFVLNTGPDDTRVPTEVSPWFEELAACRAAGLAMVCANPDLEVIRGGARVICAGALALHYASLGGQVLWVGKPDPAVYRPVFAELALPPGDVLAVGDALRTDIAGAAAVGVDACWVLGGIHGAGLAGPETAEAAARAAGLAPRATLPAFRW